MMTAVTGRVTFLWGMAVSSWYFAYVPMDDPYHVHMSSTNETHRVTLKKKEKNFGGQYIGRWFCPLKVG